MKQLSLICALLLLFCIQAMGQTKAVPEAPQLGNANSKVHSPITRDVTTQVPQLQEQATKAHPAKTKDIKRQATATPKLEEIGRKDR
jgi:hypothetical protein